MARRRFLVEAVRDGQAEIRGAQARHLARVLRTEPGRQYEISDGASVFLGEVTSAAPDRVTLRVLEKLDAPPSPVRLTLGVALIKFDHFEWLVEKATEVGAAKIIPVMAARSEKALAEGAAKRLERWRRIALESSQQARRVGPPEISPPLELGAALAAHYTWRIFLDEARGAPPLLAAAPAPEERNSSDEIALLAGPEGGWTDGERAIAIAAGWTPVSLGPLILRTETAAITAAALLMHAWWACSLE